MTRDEILQLDKHALLNEIAAGRFVRVVSANNTYRLCRIVMVTQAAKPYTVQGMRKKMQTRHQLLCAVGVQRKTIQLNMVSN